jgi:cytochrome c biogenesis protein CcmG, thiol:disulfide interchange protein DsbE
VSFKRGILLAAGAAVLAGVVAAGLVLAGGRGDTAAPVALGGDLPALGSVEPQTGTSAVEAAGVDPITGRRVSLADYAGRPVVLNFWASWCPPCRKELPALVKLAERHPEVRLVGVNYDDVAGAARALRDRIGWTWPSIADPEGKLYAELGVQGMPTTFFLDSEHRIVAVVIGGTDLAGFEKGVELISPAAT